MTAAASGGHHVVVAVVVAACAMAIVLAGIRWLRVAQREHYLPDAATRFALRWWVRRPLNAAGLAGAVAGVVLAGKWPGTAFASAGVVAVGPLGLALRGRTSALAWTRRLRTLAAIWAVLEATAVAVGVLAGYGAPVAAAAALAAPALVDLAALVAAPLENRLAGAHVQKAAARLRRVAPTVVAITGSYGKTSTKGYVAHLVSGARTVVASPASFNNRAGLARSVNEHLAEGTDVFVAEMGTYGPGEIADLCAWISPDVSVITAVGPVHLERFGSLERVLRAKAEIMQHVPCGILVEDDVRLAALADELSAGPGDGRDKDATRVVRVSATRRDADVCVVDDADGFVVLVRGEEVARTGRLEARPGNVAAAVAAALELGIGVSELARLLPTLPVAPHRLEASTDERGVTVLDDTYNANPAGADAALDALARHGATSRRRVVVTPGMVELGPLQGDENERFAVRAATVATDLVVVGHTNRAALIRGARAGAGGSFAARLVTVRTRDEAIVWVRDNVEAGDTVLYENDLPDHYP